jgi:hypothetical protein
VAVEVAEKTREQVVQLVVLEVVTEVKGMLMVRPVPQTKVLTEMAAVEVLERLEQPMELLLAETAFLRQ